MVGDEKKWRHFFKKKLNEKHCTNSYSSDNFVKERSEYMFEKHVQPTGDLYHEWPSPFSKKANSIDVANEKEWTSS